MRAIYYHRVGEDTGGPYAGVTVSAAELDAHAAELARNWRVLTLDEMAGLLAGGRRLPPRSVHVSFDDGFHDNLVAAEIFERHRVPWTLFPVVDAVLDGYRPWYVRLAGAMATSSAVVDHRGRRFDLGRAAGRSGFKAVVKAEVMAAPAARHVAVLEGALEAAGLTEAVGDGARFLSAGELRDLASRGVEVGNHSATHPNLAACTGDELRREIVDSRFRLEAALGRPVRFFAYPDGRFNRSVLAVTGSSHEAAMATWTSNRPRSPLRLRRFPVGPGVDDLRRVLAAGHPARFRAQRARWAVRRAVRSRAAVAGRRG